MSSIFVKCPSRLFAVSAIAGIGVAVAVLGTVTTPAQAADGPWCLNKDGYKDCVYASISQCLASASGQGGQCDVNSVYSAYAQYGRRIIY